MKSVNHIVVTILLLAYAGLCAGQVAPEGAPEPRPLPEAQRPAAASPELDIVLILDNSGSMRRNDPQFLAKKVATGFIRDLQDNARLGIVIFDQEARLAQTLSPVQNQSARQALLESIEAVDYSGQLTDSPAAIERAIYLLKTGGRPGAQPVIIFLTDGIVDTGDRAMDIKKETWLREDLSLDAQRAGIRIFGIAFTENADFQLIQSLAVKTGGGYFRAFRAEEIAGVFEQIGRLISQSRDEPPEAAAEQPREPEPSAQPPAESPPEVAAEEPAPAAEEAEPPPESPPEEESAEAVDAPEAAQVEPEEEHPAEPEAVWSLWVKDVPAPILWSVAGVVAGVILLVVWWRKTKPTAQKPVRSKAGRKTGRSPAPDTGASLQDLEQVSGRSAIPLKKGLLRVGRTPANDLAIERDTVSAFHATIELRDNAYYLMDRGSGNGTFVNGERIAAETPVQLNHGDEIRFDQYLFRFHMPLPQPEPKDEGTRLRSEQPRGTRLRPADGAPESPPAGAEENRSQQTPPPGVDAGGIPSGVSAPADREDEPETYLKSGMCPKHPAKKATELCTRCKGVFCDWCMTERDGEAICKACAETA